MVIWSCVKLFLEVVLNFSKSFSGSGIFLFFACFGRFFSVGFAFVAHNLPFHRSRTDSKTQFKSSQDKFKTTSNKFLPYVILKFYLKQATFPILLFISFLKRYFIKKIMCNFATVLILNSYCLYKSCMILIRGRTYMEKAFT